MLPSDYIMALRKIAGLCEERMKDKADLFFEDDWCKIYGIEFTLNGVHSTVELCDPGESLRFVDLTLEEIDMSEEDWQKQLLSIEEELRKKKEIEDQREKEKEMKELLENLNRIKTSLKNKHGVVFSSREFQEKYFPSSLKAAESQKEDNQEDWC